MRKRVEKGDTVTGTKKSNATAAVTRTVRALIESGW